jgi:hypothetical protein
MTCKKSIKIFIVPYKELFIGGKARGKETTRKTQT